MEMEELEESFKQWSPPAPEVMNRTNCSITLRWSPEKFGFLEGLIYTVQRKEKIPAWVTVYSGGKTMKTIDNLAPSNPHKFRVKASLRLTCDARRKLHQNIQSIGDKGPVDDKANAIRTKYSGISENGATVQREVISSLWSEETWSSTDSGGSTAACFCMAVRCGYLKQVQQMLEERPGLISAINSSNGFTPLATAVRKGDLNTVKVLLSHGADVNQASSTSQTPLHLAVLGGRVALAELLLEKGADVNIRDINELRMEHYAVDAGNLDILKFVLSRGDVTVRDNNGWTPLFRAVCQGARTELIEELVKAGSELDLTDRGGLALVAAAHLLRDRHGRRRESVLRLVDSQFQREKAVANFTRLTKKISTVNTLLAIK